MTDPALDPVETYRMPIIEHLRELRDRLIRCLWALGLSAIVGFAVSDPVFAFLSKPMSDALLASNSGTLAVMEATEGFVVQMKVAGLVALFLSLPVLFWQVWGFVAPGLYDTERRWVGPLVAASTVLFLLGATFCYFAVFGFGFPLFLQMNGPNITAVLSINSYLSFAITLLVAFGVAFQLPVVIFFLARLGVINHIDMIKGFRYSVVAIAIVAAVLTPPDVISMSLMGGPLLLLYGLGIIVAWASTTKPVT